MAIIAVIIILVLLITVWWFRDTSLYGKNIYLDNNGTTQPHREVVNEMSRCAWLGNPSSSYAWEAKATIEKLKGAALNWCKAYDHKVIITSGASESNNLIIRSLVDQYWLQNPSSGQGVGVKPHIVLSSIEHKTSIDCVKQLSEAGRLDATLIKPDIRGQIDPEAVRVAIKPNTILISIMTANNELGNLLNIPGIAAVADEAQVPFHTDAVQTFGKFSPDMSDKGISALSMSFHKMHGPMGIGLLILDNKIADSIQAQITGSQNDYLRGGTENIPAICGALKAMELTLAGRNDKNQKMLDLKRRFVRQIVSKFAIYDFATFAGQSDEDGEQTARSLTAGPAVVFLGPIDKHGLPDYTKTNPNTVLLSVVKNSGDKFCNIKFKSDLAADKAIVSIGSACQTGEKGASHVLHSLDAPFIIRCGVIRISLSDYTTASQIDNFVKKFISAVKLQLE